MGVSEDSPIFFCSFFVKKFGDINIMYIFEETKHLEIMNLKEQIKKHEDSIEILEFLDFLERHEELIIRSNVNFKKWSGKDLSYYPWKCQVIKRARNYAVNKYNRLNKEL